MVLKIKKNTTIGNIGSYYEILHEHINSDSPLDLMLPQSLSNAYLGLIPSLYQLIITWIRYKNSGKLLLDISNGEETEIVKIYENELIFPMVSMVWNRNGVYSKDGLTNLRAILRPHNVEMFNRMLKALPLKKGRKLLLTEFDHLDKSRGVLPCFEINNEFVKNEAALFSNLRQGLTEVVGYSADYKKVFDIIAKELNGIIFELMKNTFEWGKTDQNNVELDPSIRGAYFKLFKKRRTIVLDEFKDHLGLTDYFSDPMHKENGVGEIGFIEISVFDSGVGFVEKFKSLNNFTNLTDIEILKKCLIKHTTSAKGLDKDEKGIGLDRILNMLDTRGFMRIKTGKIDIYRNLITQKYREVANADFKSLELFDWKTHSRDEFSEALPAAGSLITVIFPLSIPFQHRLDL